MQKFTELVKSNVIVQAVLSILFGLLLALWPEITIVTVVYVLAAGIAISGIASIVSYARLKKKGASNDGVLAAGIFFLIVALVIFVFPEAVASLFSLVLGALLILSGVVNAVRSLSLKQYGGSSWIGMLIVSVLVAIGGIVIIVNPFETTVTFILVLGILFVVKGVIDLVVELVWSRSKKA